VKEWYLARKLGLTKVIQALHRREEIAKNPDSVREYQREVLWLIASYVRGYRFDKKGRIIFANLLVPDGDHLVVVARDREHRKPTARYPRDGMIVDEVFQTGDATITGDLYIDYPATDRGKKYHSILVLPVRYNDRVLAAVSIDSSRKHDFDVGFRDLVECLQPYVALLGWTVDLPKSSQKLLDKEAVP
jgi:transcriptional regulator with GAF, ATPase, and Fis domain